MTVERKAKRQIVLASSLGTAIVFLTQLIATGAASALHFLAACILSFAVPLLAWSFMNVFTQDDLSFVQRLIAWVGLISFVLGVLSALCIVSPVAGIMFVVATIVCVAEDWKSPLH